MMTDHDARPTSAQSARHRADDNKWTEVVLGAALVTMTLVTGLIFTFSAAIMPNLADADDRTFVAIMQRFNQNPVFPLTFTAALALTIVAVVIHRDDRVARRSTIAALVLYGLVVGVTAAIHFPLNDQIDQANLDSVTDLAGVRDDVESSWVVWNLVRTVLSTAAVAALACSLILRGRRTAERNPRERADAPAWAPPASSTQRQPLPPTRARPG